MNPRIEILKETRLAGKRLQMSFANNRTTELWQSFMPLRKEIKNIIGADLFSIEVYPEGFFKDFNPTALFEKWAAIEVFGFTNIPAVMESIILPAGLYAVFLYKGLPINASATYEYIFLTWLPASDFELDNRPHFALMGEKYKSNDASAEEELWIPVKQRSGGNSIM